MVSLCVRCRERYVEQEEDITVEYGTHVWNNVPRSLVPELLLHSEYFGGQIPNYETWSIVEDCKHSRVHIQLALGLMMGEGLKMVEYRLYDDKFLT